MVERRLGVLKRILPAKSAVPDPAKTGGADLVQPLRKRKLGYLSAQEIFRDLTEVEMGEIDRTTAMQACRTGQVFYQPGQTGEALFLLKKGKVTLYRLSPEGRKLVTAQLGPGTFFGEMAVIGQGMYNTFAEAAEDSTICVMSHADVERLLLGHPKVALRLLETVGQRLLETETKLEDSTFRDVPSRLAALLLRLAREQSSPSQVTGLSHQELADYLGIYRETVTSALDRLKDGGLVELGRKRITILRPDDLRDLAED
jgi:CRP/FNR family cyclic AMP-dependent transcriptional regulator